MSIYRVTYYTMSDGTASATIEASNPVQAAELASQREDFHKLIETRKESNTMTTPTPTPAQQAAEAFRDEVRNAFDLLHVEIAELRADLAQMRGGLQQAATAPAQVGTFSEMMIDTIVMTYDDNGKPAYKGLGAPFQKFGVRIWDEILPQFTDPATLKPGKNAISPTPARVLMNTPEEGKTAQPRKITGKV